MSPIEIRREINAVNTNTPFEKYRLGYTVNGGELQSLRIEGKRKHNKISSVFPEGAAELDESRTVPLLVPSKKL